MMDAVGSERGAPEASGLGSEQPVTAREAVEKMVPGGDAGRFDEPGR
jgi:hypothetical protein